MASQGRLKASSRDAQPHLRFSSNILRSELRPSGETQKKEKEKKKKKKKKKRKKRALR